MIVDIWIYNGFVMIYDGSRVIRRGVKPEESETAAD